MTECRIESRTHWYPVVNRLCALHLAQLRLGIPERDVLPRDAAGGAARQLPLFDEVAA